MKDFISTLDLYAGFNIESDSQPTSIHARKGPKKSIRKIHFIIGTFIMKKTNAINKKLSNTVCIIVASIFAANVSAASANDIDVINIDKNNFNSIINQAKIDLGNSLKNMPLHTMSANKSALKQLTLQAKAFNQKSTLVNIVLVAE
jgi:hypothetical protein